MKIIKENLGGQIMKKTEKKQFKELSEEQLKEVTGGGIPPVLPMMACIPSITDNPCPGMRFDSQCHCLG